MRAADLAAIAVVFVAAVLSVPPCAGHPWHHRQQRQRPARPTAEAAVQREQPSTSAVAYDTEYDEPSAAPSDRNAYRREPPVLPDYGEPDRTYAEPERVYAEPEQNYEVDEAVSVLSDGRVHGVQQQQQTPTTVSPESTDGAAAATGSTTAAAETRKSGYVVDSKHYRKYRVEEETPDGFIVGEYGVVSHHDGTTRGVRYTADSSINPRVIYEALAKFLALRRRR